MYTKVLELEDTKGEWGFKALKQMIKLHFKLVGIYLFYWSSYIVVDTFKASL